MTIPASAETITINDSLALLDGPFRAFAEGVAEDRYTFWLGSGISLGRVAGLQELVPRVIEFLRASATPGNPDCRFRRALEEVLTLAQFSDEECKCIDLSQPFQEWQHAHIVTNRLISRYAQILDTQVDGEKEDFLLWDGLRVVTTFADANTEPDVEHLCIAILILEGVASDIASANWDGLIEKAVGTLTIGQSTVLAVHVRAADLREPALRSQLFKFHGCAVKASTDETTFRPYLVARQSQIHRWISSSENIMMVNRLVNLITSKPTLMMGLSAQDANIQAIFAKAEAIMAWPWPGDRPSYVFSENAIGVDQQSLLRNVYRDAYRPNNRQEITDSALLPAYAKPLLVSLVLYVVCSKLTRMIQLASGDLDSNGRETLKSGVVVVREKLAAEAESDRLGFVTNLIDQSSRAIMAFRDGHVTAAPRPYNPITPTPIQAMAADTTLPASGLREAAVAIGVLGMGISEGLWTLDSVETDDDAAVVRINSAAGSAKAYFVMNSLVALRLVQSRHLKPGNDTVVINSLERIPLQPRSPRAAPGRTGKIGPREVSISELMREAPTSAALIQRFRKEVAL